MISIRNLKKQFGSTLIFDHVSIEIERGDALVVIGPSGCGKSTLLRCINRMETPTSGQILVDGEDILAPGAPLDRMRQKMGMVYQNFNLFSNLNVLENLILAPMKVRGISKEQAIEEAMALLATVGMVNRRFHMPNQLSGGQKQRVAIARCLAMQPEIILFDEPTSALDPTMVDEVLGVMRRLVEQKMTSVIVTHEMNFAESIATKVVYLDEKSVYEMGTAEQIFRHPQRERTQTFIDRLKVWERTITKENLDVYSFMTEVTAYCTQYGFTKRQMNAVNSIYEELIMPMVGKGGQKEVIFRLRCGERSDVKDIYVEFPSMQGDPMAHAAVDEYGAILLRSLFTKQEATQGDSGAMVHFTL